MTQENVTSTNITHKSQKVRTIKPLHLGESKRMSNGHVGTIICYRNINDIDVEFENGIVAKNRRYDSFARGEIGWNNEIKSLRIGETSKMTCGLIAEIIVYRNANDIDIRFEDGTIREHVNYAAFRKGRVSLQYMDLDTSRAQRTSLHKQERTGLQRTFSDGGSVTILDYINSTDCTYLFSNGVKKEHVPFRLFYMYQKCPVNEP